MSKKLSFFSKNLVAIVMVPTIFGLHYGWYKLQMNDKLVTIEDRQKYPVIQAIDDFFSFKAIKQLFEKTQAKSE